MPGFLHQHLAFLEFIHVGTGADNPVPGPKIGDTRDFQPSVGVSGIFPGIQLFGNLPGLKSGCLGADFLNERGTIGILGFPDTLAIALAVFGNYIVALAVEDKDVAGFADLNIHNGLAKRGNAFLRDAEIQGADDFFRFIEQRFVCGNIPLIDDKRPSDVRFALRQRGHHRIGCAVRLRARDKRADGPFALKGLNVGANAQHIPGVVHTLENGAGSTDQIFHFIHHRRRFLDICILPQPGLADHHPGQCYRLRCFVNLIGAVPGDCFWRQTRLSGLSERLFGDIQAVLEILFNRFLLGLAHGVHIFRDMVQIGSGRTLRLFRGKGNHAAVLIPCDYPCNQQRHDRQYGPCNQQFRPQFHSCVHKALPKSLLKRNDGLFRRCLAKGIGLR